MSRSSTTNFTKLYRYYTETIVLQKWRNKTTIQTFHLLKYLEWWCLIGTVDLTILYHRMWFPDIHIYSKFYVL